MSQGKLFSETLKALPTATSLTGMTLLAIDANGNMHKAEAGLVAPWLTATNLIPSFVKLPVGTDMDADKLTTQSCTIYVPSGDLNGHTALFTNFPKNKPEGGFSLICIKEGNWQRQIYMDYTHHDVYIRFNQYSSSGNVFKPWKKITPEAIV